MSDLSQAQFQGVSDILQHTAPKQRGGSGRSPFDTLEVGLHPTTGRLQLQPAGTTNFHLAAAFDKLHAVP